MSAETRGRPKPERIPAMIVLEDSIKAAFHELLNREMDAHLLRCRSHLSARRSSVRARAGRARRSAEQRRGTRLERRRAYDFWRPIVGIRHADRDGNPFTIADRRWTPVGSPGSNQGPSRMTPSFPAYVSGHSSFGTAMFQVLTRYYGTDRMNFCIISDEFNGITTDAQGNVRPEMDRCYSSFSQASQENASSRIYLGVHWRFDAVAGIRLGKEVGNAVFDRIIRPLP
ncbi:vanadium-dependent haloperoxidase [Sorangium sp. So ce887]|uniref:vanadium-dependent haloperoxidase n=1 Tax=Sorangium sp. So ce887 TaxID=3133324 RepID=UPI003F6087F6